MPARLVFVLSVFLIVPAFSQQQGSVMQRIDQRYALHDSHMRPEPAPEVDQRANRQRAINHDIEELSALSTSLQSDFQQLQKGLLAKDLDQKLKKMEKLSKRLRQEMAQQN
jgi:hypothetical protein